MAELEMARDRRDTRAGAWVVFRPAGWEYSVWCLAGDPDDPKTWQHIREEAELVEVAEDGITVQIVRMSAEKVASLPEFEGF